MLILQPGAANYTYSDRLFIGPFFKETMKDLEPKKSGPIRCVKQGPGKPIPPTPPVVEILPPTDRNHFVPPPEWDEIRARFNQEDYRGCVEPIEALFFARRNTFHQGLLQYVVALLQLRLGLFRSARRLLQQALDLLEPYPEWQEGADLSAIRQHAQSILDHLPEDIAQAHPKDALRYWTPPPFQL